MLLCPRDYLSSYMKIGTIGLLVLGILVSGTFLADGEWHFVVGTMNPATDSTKLYVDGALRGALHGTIGSLSSGGVRI